MQNQHNLIVRAERSDILRVESLKIVTAQTLLNSHFVHNLASHVNFYNMYFHHSEYVYVHICIVYKRIRMHFIWKSCLMFALLAAEFHIVWSFRLRKTITFPRTWYVIHLTIFTRQDTAAASGRFQKINLYNLLHCLAYFLYEHYTQTRKQ